MPAVMCSLIMQDLGFHIFSSSYTYMFYSLSILYLHFKLLNEISCQTPCLLQDRDNVVCSPIYMCVHGSNIILFISHSRAHTIVGITFVQKSKNAAGEEMAKTAVINLVDLAGR